MTKRLTFKAIWYAMNQLEKGKRAPVMVAELGVAPRHIRGLRAKFRETGSLWFCAFRAGQTCNRRLRRMGIWCWMPVGWRRSACPAR